MYWIYFGFFVLVVFTPLIAETGEFFGFLHNENASEMMALLVFGGAMVYLYHRRDTAWRKTEERHHLCQREMSDARKDLASTYSYIGEANRKIDILSEVSAQLPELVQSRTSDADKACAPIMEAIEIFCASSRFVIGFYNASSRKMLHQCSVSDDFSPEVESGVFLRAGTEGKSVFRTQDGLCVIRTRKTIHGTGVFVVLERNNIRPDDADLIQSLAIQALFVYVSIEARRRKNI